jgi:hypothetical protein
MPESLPCDHGDNPPEPGSKPEDDFEIDSIWKNYDIIKFPWNKYYAGTNISSHKEGGIRGLGFQVKIV